MMALNAQLTAGHRPCSKYLTNNLQPDNSHFNINRCLVTIQNELLVNVGQDELDIANGFFEPEM